MLKRMRNIIIVSAILGFLDASYLMAVYLNAQDLKSEYSEFLGLPVAMLGMAGYLIIFLCELAALEKHWEFAQKYSPMCVFLLSLFGTLFSLRMMYISVFVIHALCPFCAASAVLMLIVFVLASVRLTIRIRKGYKL